VRMAEGNYYGDINDLTQMQTVVYGYLAVLGANIFFGSFGVPIKSKKVTEAQVDPVIYQAYKSFAVFASSWLVLLYVDFYFTWWGFVGASMWVPNGILAIISIRMIGLGAGQGIWSGLTVWVSFVWGATLLGEAVQSWAAAVVALILLAVGIMGVAWVNDSKNRRLRKKAEDMERSIQQHRGRKEEREDSDIAAWRGSSSEGLEEEEGALFSSKRQEQLDLEREELAREAEDAGRVRLARNPSRHCWIPAGMDGTEAGIIEKFVESRGAGMRSALGLACAVFIGFSNGSMLLPLSFAPPEAQGITYIISFGIGAMCITAAMLAGYCAVLYLWKKPLPSFQVKVAALPALTTGLLWAGGNYCSIYATLFLGQTIGYPLVQCSLLVAGLWGIFWYKEITGRWDIAFFFIWTAVVLYGVFLLSIAG